MFRLYVACQVIGWLQFALIAELTAQTNENKPTTIAPIKLHLGQKIVEKAMLTTRSQDTTISLPLRFLDLSIYENQPKETQKISLEDDHSSSPELTYMPEISKFSFLLKAGVGNYEATFGEALLSLTNLPTNNQWKLYAKHQNWQRGALANDYSGFGQNEIYLANTYWLTNNTLKSQVGYAQNYSFWYGNQNIQNLDKYFLRQIFEQFYFKTNYQSLSTASTKIDYQIRQFYQRNRTTSQEITNELNLNTYLATLPSRENLLNPPKLKIEGQVWHNFSRHAERTLNQSRWVLNIRPFAEQQLWNFSSKVRISAKIGLPIFYLNDGLPHTSQWRVFLFSQSQFFLPKQWALFVELDAQTQNHTLQSISQENPFLAQNQLLRTNYERKIHFNLQKSWGKDTHLQVGIKALNVDNLPFFANLQSDTAQIGVFYAKTNVLQYFSQIQHKFRYDLKAEFKVQYADFKHFNLHYPTFTADLKIHYAPSQRLSFQSHSFSWMGIERSQSYLISNTNLPQNISTQKISPIFDINLTANYLIFENFYTSLLLNNLLNRTYQRFYHYPTQAFHFLIRLQYAFGQ
ncbi:MAG: hypothetical protein NZ551_01080 [Microscillaceae bacterium]|nr:hypothetical protein [Microscillaceae bacterium]MDW8459782.1 hypothetical protein [Cytophagales bacterium]